MSTPLRQPSFNHATPENTTSDHATPDHATPDHADNGRIINDRIINSQFASLLDSLAINEGLTQSPIAGVDLYRANRPEPRNTAIYDASILIAGQGRKRCQLANESYTFDSGNYLVVSVPLPLECHIFEASTDSPFLALRINIDLSVLRELILDLDEQKVSLSTIKRGIYIAPLSDNLLGASSRLLTSLNNKTDAKVLGPQIVREIYYHVLRGEHGGALRAATNRHGRFNQISKVLRLIHNSYDQALDVESMAKLANMSPSTLHHNFKTVTSMPPLQYLKNIRLNHARNLLIKEGINTGTAAHRVGYTSASQFSREYKRQFGESPSEEVRRLRAAYV